MEKEFSTYYVTCKNMSFLGPVLYVVESSGPTFDALMSSKHTPHSSNLHQLDWSLQSMMIKSNFML